jgi:hypothetical protein
MLTLNINRLFLIIAVIHTARAQFYQSLNPYSYEVNPSASPLSSSEDENSQATTEKRFVNSGQSIELICDLPNNMPDGKVSFTKF